MDTDAVAVLVAAAATDSLSAAARRLGISPMLATRRLAALEMDLGVRLMHRTTRSLSLTPEGEAFLPYAQALLESELAGRAQLRPAQEGASGLLRVSASLAFGRKVVAPILPGLLRDNPDLRIDLELNDGVIDIVGSGLDLAIRIAHLRENGLIAHKLADNPRVLCAAPSYVAARGAPATVADLAGHDCLALTGVSHWIFEAEGRRQQVRIHPRVCASSIEGLHEVCLGGGGIVLISHWNVREDLAAGRLVTLPLLGTAPEDLAIWAVYPTRRLVLPKVRLFIAALEARLAQP